MHKKAYGIKLPGMYSRNSNEGLEYKVRLLEDDQGNTRLTADLDLAPVMAEIYRAERYTEETQGEIEEIRNLLGPDTIGLAQRVNDVIRGINALSGTSRGLDVEIEFETMIDDDETSPTYGQVIDVTDEFGQPVLTEKSQKVASEVMSRWAKRFTAQNITTLLGESNRTISDADRKRADDIVNVLSTTTDMTSAWIALDELLHIFEKPSQNANTALQALYAQAEQSGYMDEVLEIEKGLSDEIKRGGTRLSIPQSSRFKFEAVSASDIPKDAVIRTINVAGGS
jgi:nucleotide-binding universal stress UspA family protein